jgi:hypothetical protein
MTFPRSSGDRRIPQLIPHRLLHSTQLHHPAVLEEAKQRSANIQLRLADRITAFAGSMNFVWIQWLYRFTEFVGTKRGLATALHSGDPAFDALPGYFTQRLEPVLESLLAAATATGEIRNDVTAKDLIHTVALLCRPVPGEELAYNQRMVAVFVDGLRRTGIRQS